MTPRIATAAVALTAIALVATGCSSSAPSGASSSPMPTDEMPTATYTPPSGAVTTPSGDIVLSNVQPNDGPAPVAEFIATAAKSVDVSIYRIDSTFTPVIDALTTAAKSGIPVRVSISRQLVGADNPPAGNSAQLATIAQLKALGIQAALSRPEFHYGHEKSIVIDAGTPQAKAMVADWNLQNSYFGPSQYGPVGARGFAVIDSNPADVAMIAAYFNANWPNYSPWPVSNRASLVWSPSGVQFSPVGNSVAALRNLMSGAKRTLDIYAEYIEPTSFMLPDVIERAKAGVKVRIVANSSGQSPETVTQLRDAGVDIVFDPTNTIDPSATMFVHAKSVIVDGDEPEARAFVGSQNQFLNESLEAILELGTLVTDRRSVATIQQTFDTDFSRSTKTQASPSPSVSTSPAPSTSPASSVTTSGSTSPSATSAR
jgi:phosphatidylserine/phosphatidylglycerophosphate/cardiolipin synthase-like enzyme